MRLMKWYVTLITLMFLAGCATQTKMYYYGDYSSKYYKMVKKQDVESTSNFIKTLNTIIAKSNNEYHTPVPPGIYCDYGMIMVKQSNFAEAHKYFNLEKKLWPESAPLMDYLIELYK